MVWGSHAGECRWYPAYMVELAPPTDKPHTIANTPPSPPCLNITFRVGHTSYQIDLGHFLNCCVFGTFKYPLLTGLMWHNHLNRGWGGQAHVEQISDFNHRTRTCRSRVHQDNRKMLLGELRTMRSKEEFPQKWLIGKLTFLWVAMLRDLGVT